MSLPLKDLLFNFTYTNNNWCRRAEAGGRAAFGWHLLSPAAHTSGHGIHPISLNQIPGDPARGKNHPPFTWLLVVLSRKVGELNLSPRPKHSVAEKTFVRFCRGPSWKIPQEVQSRVSSCNWILKFTSARANCAGSEWDVPSSRELQGDDAFHCCR